MILRFYGSKAVLGRVFPRQPKIKGRFKKMLLTPWRQSKNLPQLISLSASIGLGKETTVVLISQLHKSLNDWLCSQQIAMS